MLDVVFVHGSLCGIRLPVRQSSLADPSICIGQSSQRILETSLLEVRIDPDLNADRPIPAQPSLDSPDHLAHQFRFPQKCTTDTLIIRPSLRTSAVQVDSIDVRRNQLRRVCQGSSVRRGELRDQSSSDQFRMLRRGFRSRWKSTRRARLMKRNTLPILLPLEYPEELDPLGSIQKTPRSSRLVVKSLIRAAWERENSSARTMGVCITWVS